MYLRSACSRRSEIRVEGWACWAPSRLSALLSALVHDEGTSLVSSKAVRRSALLFGLNFVSWRLRVVIIVVVPGGKFFVKYCPIPVGATTVMFEVGIAEVGR